MAKPISYPKQAWGKKKQEEYRTCDQFGIFLTKFLEQDEYDVMTCHPAGEAVDDPDVLDEMVAHGIGENWAMNTRRKILTNLRACVIGLGLTKDIYVHSDRGLATVYKIGGKSLEVLRANWASMPCEVIRAMDKKKEVIDPVVDKVVKGL